LVDSNVLIKRIGRIRRCVAVLEGIRRTHSKAQFLKDETIQAVTERNIQIAVQAVMDISSHVVADMKLELPDEHKQAFAILAKNKVIPQSLARTLTGMAGVRNVLVHEYLDVDQERLYAIISRNLGDFEKFVKVISKLL